MRLILASNSKWRKQILEEAGFACEVIASNVDEISDAVEPTRYVEELSILKARAVSKKVEKGIIIAADTIGYMDAHKFEKPKNREEAFENLKQLAGKVNYAVTGVTILDLYQGKEVTFSESTKVFFKEMTKEEINWYIEHEKTVYQSSGYSIETKGSLFIEKIEGDYKNVLGLPVCRIYQELKNLGYTIDDFECSDE